VTQRWKTSNVCRENSDTVLGVLSRKISHPNPRTQIHCLEVCSETISICSQFNMWHLQQKILLIAFDFTFDRLVRPAPLLGMAICPVCVYGSCCCKQLEQDYAGHCAGKRHVCALLWTRIPRPSCCVDILQQSSASNHAA
jgi:hypothetical protein